MVPIKNAAMLAIVIALFPIEARPTDRFFRDLSVESPASKYRVDAKSPDNSLEGKPPPFQSSFVYTCCDTKTKNVLWVRNQPMSKPAPIGKNSTRMYSFPNEGSPAAIFVSDEGWTVIWTGLDDLIAVDLMGKDRGCVDILTDGFTREENTKFVHETTAGPMWSGYSLWYFLEVGKQQLFVVRPWWGRRIVLNLETGKLIDEHHDVYIQAMRYEKNYVMTELVRSVETRKRWEKEEFRETIWPVLNACYLAGRIPVAEAAPFLEELQNVAYSGSSTNGSFGERFEGEVGPRSYKTFTLRQIVQLSLRRLGKKPLQLPANRFDVQFEGRVKIHPYIPKPHSDSRDRNAEKIEIGLKAEQVLDLLGEPDYVGRDTWEYDMDTDPPFSLTVKWDTRHVVDVQKTTPALWKDTIVRDEQIVR